MTFILLRYSSGKNITEDHIGGSDMGDYIDQADSLDFIYSQIKNLRKN